MEAEQKESLIRIVTAALLTAGAHLFMDAGPMKPGESLVTRLWESLPYFAAYAVISWNILIKAWKNIRRGQVFDENFLMAVASLGAFFLGFFHIRWKLSLKYLESTWISAETRLRLMA